MQGQRTCSIPDCSKAHIARGWGDRQLGGVRRDQLQV